jgi:hypothetical protein
VSLTDFPSAEAQAPKPDSQVTDAAFFDSACQEINRIHEEYLSGRLNINEEHRRGLVEISQLLLDIELPPDDARAARLLVVSRQMADLLTAEAPTTQVPIVVIEPEAPAAPAPEVPQAFEYPVAEPAPTPEPSFQQPQMPVPDQALAPQAADQVGPTQNGQGWPEIPYTPPVPAMLQPNSPTVVHLPAPDNGGREGLPVESWAPPIPVAEVPVAMPAPDEAKKSRWGRQPKAPKAEKPGKAPKAEKPGKAPKAEKPGKAPKAEKPGKAPKQPRAEGRKTRLSVVALLVVTAIAGGLGYAAYKDRSDAAKYLHAEQAQTAMNTQLAPQLVTVEKDLAGVNGDIKSLDGAITVLGNGLGSHASSAEVNSLRQTASAASQVATALQQCVSSTISLQASFGDTLAAGSTANLAPGVARVERVCGQAEQDAQVLQADLPSGS